MTLTELAQAIMAIDPDIRDACPAIFVDSLDNEFEIDSINLVKDVPEHSHEVASFSITDSRISEGDFVLGE